MTDHADTIRRYIQKSYPPAADQRDGKFPGADANDALTALLAERQQLQEERDALRIECEGLREHYDALESELAQWRDSIATETLRAQLRQAIDALREIAHGYDGDEFQDSADACERHIDIARAALVKLGEKP